MTLELTAGGKVKVNATGGVQVIGGEISLSGTGILLGGEKAALSPLLEEIFLAAVRDPHPRAPGRPDQPASCRSCPPQATARSP